MWNSGPELPHTAAKQSSSGARTTATHSTSDASRQRSVVVTIATPSPRTFVSDSMGRIDEQQQEEENSAEAPGDAQRACMGWGASRMHRARHRP